MTRLEPCPPHRSSEPDPRRSTTLEIVCRGLQHLPSIQGTQFSRTQYILISMASYGDSYFVSQDSGLQETKAWLAENGSRVHPAFLLPFSVRRPASSAHTADQTQVSSTSILIAIASRAIQKKGFQCDCFAYIRKSAYSNRFLLQD